MELLHFDLAETIKTIGYIGIFTIVFAESGLFFGFFFPGDSLLFTSGFLASQGYLDIKLLTILVMLAAVAGDSVGYWTGHKFGSWLLKRKESFLFSKHNLQKAQDFYDKHGGKTLILARFIPAVRTFVPIVAGMAGMEYKRFLSFNIFGGILWGAGMTLLGYYLGNVIPNVDRYLIPIVLVIIVASVVPGIIHMRGDIIKLLKKNPITAKLLKLKENWLGKQPLP